MVDIGYKPAVFRMAVATGFIRLKADTVKKIKTGKLPKGDVRSVAQIAAVLAVKKTPGLVLLTHPIPITGIDVNVRIEKGGVRVEVRVRSTGQTGVEMEALAGVAGALLTIWDMTKSLEKDQAGQYPTTHIKEIRVLKKVKI